MTLASFLLGFVLSSLYGALFHLWRGGNIYRLMLYLILSWMGFWIGHFLASFLDWTFLSIGPLHVGLASITSILFLFIGYWLSLLPRKTSNLP
jgi:hypothetical protein